MTTSTPSRIRSPRVERRRVLSAPAPVRPELGLEDLEELLLAVGDREDIVGPDGRARLARGRRFLELELDRHLRQ